MKLLLLFVLAISAELRVTTFSTPGNYTFTPSDYGLAQELIVEVWGAGGGGCSGNCGIGGGSGAYIKSMINTNQESFNISVGLGGKGQNGFTNIYSNSIPVDSTNGTSSSFTNNRINITAGGGHYGNMAVISKSYYDPTIGTVHYSYCDNHGIILSISGNILFATNGNNGGIPGYFNCGCFSQTNMGCCTDWDYHSTTFAGDGGSTIGGFGGKGGNGTSCGGTNAGNNGTTPAGGGGGSYVTGFMPHQPYCGDPTIPTFSCKQAGNGGNGTVRITYDYFAISPSSTVTLSRSPSATENSAVSNTPSRTISASRSLIIGNSTIGNTPSNALANYTDIPSISIEYSNTSISYYSLIIICAVILVAGICFTASGLLILRKKSNSAKIEVANFEEL